MIEPSKLFQLEGGQKRRKLALTYGSLERDILGIAEKGTEYNFKSMSRSEYIKKITELFLKDPKLSEEAGLKSTGFCPKIQSMSSGFVIMPAIVFLQYLEAFLLNGT